MQGGRNISYKSQFNVLLIRFEIQLCCALRMLYSKLAKREWPSEGNNNNTPIARNAESSCCYHSNNAFLRPCFSRPPQLDTCVSGVPSFFSRPMRFFWSFSLSSFLYFSIDLRGI